MDDLDLVIEYATKLAKLAILVVTAWTRIRKLLKRK